jgi:hypothetical protein
VRPVDSVLFQVEEERPRLPVEVADTEGGGFRGRDAKSSQDTCVTTSGWPRAHAPVCVSCLGLGPLLVANAATAKAAHLARLA